MDKKQRIIIKVRNMDENKVVDLKKLCTLYRKWSKKYCSHTPKLEIINLKHYGFDQQYLYVAHDMDYDGHNIMSGYEFINHIVDVIRNRSNDEHIKFWEEIL